MSDGDRARFLPPPAGRRQPSADRRPMEQEQGWPWRGPRLRVVDENYRPFVLPPFEPAPRRRGLATTLVILVLGLACAATGEYVLVASRHTAEAVVVGVTCSCLGWVLLAVAGTRWMSRRR